MSHSGVKGSLLPPTTADIAILNQAAAVQNTWYTVLDARNVIVYFATTSMSTLAENIEVRLTVDGVVYTGAQAAAIAGTVYFIYVSNSASALVVTTTRNYVLGTFLTARSFKMEIRKTSANAANTLNGYCNYGRF